MLLSTLKKILLKSAPSLNGHLMAFYAISNISRKNNSGNKKLNIFLFRKTIVDRDNGNLYPIYIEKQQLWC